MSAGAVASPSGTLSLGFEDRRRSRQLARLDDGREVGLNLPRGTVLRDGDRLSDEAEPSTVVVVRAAAETLSVARSTDAHLLARAAYHLGNRHVPLQVAPDHVAYQHDHVLDGLVRDLGMSVATESAPFEPEAGGYRHDGTGRHEHGHGAHAHEHPHGHGHRHGP
ncbi:MAG TPA: urease accessory protein UreE [Polyangia bacterium]|jgi:urease accessory protein